MMHILFLLILSVCLTAEPIELTDKNSYETLAHFTYTEAVEINESPLELDNREWKKNTDEFTTLNKEHQYYWIKFKINNITSRSKELYLFDERRYIFNLTYFVIKNGEIIKSTDSGCMVNGNYSKFGSSLQIFSLDVDVNESLDILIKIQNFNQLDTPYKLVSKEYLVNYLEKYNFLQGMFFAIILIMGIYNLIIYFILKNKLYLYHFIYTVLLILYQGNYFGYFYKFDLYLIPISLQSAIGGLGFLIFVIFFFEELLNIKKHLPFISKLLSFSMSFLGITLFFYLWALSSKNFEYSQFLFNVTNVFVPFYIGLILFTLYYLTYKKIDKIIKLFAIVWTLIGTAGLFLMGMHLNIISTSWGVDYYFQVAIFIESSLFSTILAFHVISLKKEKLEQEKILIQQSKFVDMGKMIKAIAHQWRQPLSEINGVVLNMDIDYKKNRLDDTRIEKHLNSIETTTAYLSKTIADFLNFFRHDKEVEKFMLSSVINDAITLLSNRQVEEYNIVYIKDDNDVEIHAYKSELTQAILIILNNSIDALIGTNTTYPTILIRLQEIDEEVSIMIQDNGGGIPLDIKERIYDPYFTTKHESQGTGLGLYILKILIEKSMQGSIEASNTNNGLKTILYIPQNISTINAVFR